MVSDQSDLPMYLGEALPSLIIQFFIRHCCFIFGTSPLASATVVGLLEPLTVSNSSEFRSFLPSVCVDAQESTTNSVSPCFVAERAGKHKTSISEKQNVALSYFFEV